jgi:phosphoesterase RecJ-like protein
LNIDHHPTNEKFGKFNLIDASASATAEILAELMPLWELPITTDVAAALLTGLITDTIGFRTSSVTSKTMRIAAYLIDCGADISDLYLRSLVLRSYESTRFWGAGLSHLEREGSIVWTKLTAEDRKQAGYSGRDDADLINVLSAIKDASIAVVFVEQPSGSVKISWRAQPGLDVAQLALRFGGGGHAAAAGAELRGTLDEVMAKVLHETHSLLVN